MASESVRGLDPDLLAAVFDGVADGILAYDCDRNVVAMNRAAEEITGYSLAEAMGRSAESIFRGELCTRVCDGCGSEHACEAISDLGVRFTTLDGESRVLRMHRTSFGAIGSGCVVIFRDVTQLAKPEREVGSREGFHGYVGEHATVHEVVSIVQEVADGESTVLILGETGTGKELVARAVHAESGRARKPFVTVNCSAFHEGLLESDLFGHVKGSFTGAIADRVGRFQAADGGTIFLDEIGDAPLPVQVRLLRVLQERTLERVGDSRSSSVDVRVIAATNQDLTALMRGGQFREDLYYRLRVVPVHLPALRDRPSDIPLLLDHFIHRFNRVMGRTVLGIEDGCIRALAAHCWPGNVRELEHAIEHAFVRCRGEVLAMSDFPKEVVRPEEAAPRLGAPGGHAAEEIQDALQRTGGNRTEAARLLGVDRTTLWRRMKRLGLSG